MTMAAGEPRFVWSRVASAGAVPAVPGVLLTSMPGVHTSFALAAVLVVSAISAAIEATTQVGPGAVRRHPIATRTAVLVALVVWVAWAAP